MNLLHAPQDHRHACMRIDMQRTVLDGVLSPAQCQGLLLLARSLAVLGYRRVRVGRRDAGWPIA